MKLINAFSLTFLLFTIWLGPGLTVLTPLEDSLNETSGLLYLEDKLISIDDAREPIIREVDPATGEVVRKVVVSNAFNCDWEDITADDEYIYIADIGNNFGKRASLKIYRIAKADYLNTGNATVTAEIIHFRYADQEVYNSPLFTTNYDAEALEVVGDKLYLFTKNWGNRKTDVYEIPKEPGKYAVSKVGQIDAGGLITGASYDVKGDRMLLSGNNVPSPFILEIRNFSTGNYSAKDVRRHNAQPKAGYSIQIEGITFAQGDEVYLSAEKNIAGKAGLYSFKLPRD